MHAESNIHNLILYLSSKRLGEEETDYAPSDAEVIGVDGWMGR
jgi:hypothetical protein